MFFWKFMRTFFKTYEKRTNVLWGKIQGLNFFLSKLPRDLR
jgi:hypothetical protein